MKNEVAKEEELQLESVGTPIKWKLIGTDNIGWQSLSDLEYTTTEKLTINVNKLKFYLSLLVQQTYHIVLASMERDRILRNQK